MARLTDALVLVCFIAVNLSLDWLAARRRTDGGSARRATDLVVPALGAALCGWLLLEAGWTWIAVAAVLGAVGVVLAAATVRRTTGF
jgi:hypothetical protein